VIDYRIFSDILDAMNDDWNVLTIRLRDNEQGQSL